MLEIFEAGGGGVGIQNANDDSRTAAGDNTTTDKMAKCKYRFRKYTLGHLKH